jgi:hypothetical protein
MTRSELEYYIRRLRSARITDPYWRIAACLGHMWQKRQLERDRDAYSLDSLCRRPDQWLSIDAGQGLIQRLNDSVRGRLPAEWWIEDVFWKEFSRLYPLDAEAVCETAEMALKGEFLLFQWRVVKAGKSIPWSLVFDPSHPTAEWPKVHFPEVRYAFDPNRPEQDVKWCWELNRFQHLLCLGAAWRITGQERFAEGARAQLDDWMQHVRYPIGVQWSSTLEVALRALSWARCHILCMNSKAWSEDFTARFLANLYVHCRHIDAELSLDHARTNHLLGEIAALAYLSILYRPFRGSERWLRRSLGILRWLVPELILADGVYAEQTTGYFRFAAEFLLPLIDAAATNHIRLPEIVPERLLAGLKFIKSLSPTNSDIPMIGDADNGMAIGWQISDYWDFSPLLASGAALVDEPCLIDGMDKYPAESFLLLGDRGREWFENHGRNRQRNGGSAASAARKCSSLLHLPVGGYQISADRTFHVIFDGGPLGIYPGFGHGHADGLSFLLYYKGAPVIVDPGTFHYNGPVRWREYFRSTKAHNTVSIDDLSQSATLGTFRWSRPLDIMLETPLQGKDWRLLRGRIKWPGVVHHRFVLHIIDRGLIVIDHLEGKGSHTLNWSLNLAPSWDLRQHDRTRFVASADGADLAIQLVQPGDAHADVLYGSETPVGGWYSRFYGLKEPCYNLRSVLSADLPVMYVLTVKPPGEELIIPEDAPFEKLPDEIVDIVRSLRCA